MDPDECRTVREAEQVESAAHRRRREVDFLGLPDGILEYGVPLRRAIAEEVRRHRPDIVITGNFRDTWGGRNLNQADHIATGRAVLDAVRDAGNRWVFREQLDRRARALGRRTRGVGGRLPAVRRTRSTSPTPSTRASPRWRRTRPTSTGLGWENFDPREFLEGMSRATGQRLGVALRRAVRGVPDGLGRLTQLPGGQPLVPCVGARRRARLTVAQLCRRRVVAGHRAVRRQGLRGRLVAYPLLMLLAPAIWWLVVRRRERTLPSAVRRRSRW